MKYVRFKNLPEHLQREMDEDAVKWSRGLLKEYKHDPEFLVETCAVCGYPATLCESLDDSPAACEGRDVTVRCKCGRVYMYGA